MLSAIERICRAGQGQLKMMSMMLIRISEARPCSSDDIRMRMGNEGTTMKTSASKVMTPVRDAAEEAGRQPGEDADERGEESHEQAD